MRRRNFKVGFCGSSPGTDDSVMETGVLMVVLGAVKEGDRIAQLVLERVGLRCVTRGAWIVRSRC